MSDWNAILATNKEIITQDHRVYGVKMCTDSLKNLAGVQLQLSVKNGASLDKTITLGSLGVTEPCNNVTIFNVKTYITSIAFYYSTKSGVS